MKPKIIIHGGAWEWEDALDAGKHEGLKKAISIGNKILTDGGSALDAVEQTVIALENNPVFDAGTGGYLNQDGQVQLDALFVDGAKLDFGAVAGVTAVKNPISLARKIMEQTAQCFFVGEGANRQAELLGMQRIANIELVTPQMQQYFNDRRLDGPSDTVGAIALDVNGNFAAATSTSGTPYKPAGRVGDSPLFGSGAFAQNGVGAAGATGQGEHIMRALLSKYACDRLDATTDAIGAAVASAKYVESLFANSMSGVIIIDKNGKVGAAHTSPKLAFAFVDDKGLIRTAMRADMF